MNSRYDFLYYGICIAVGLTASALLYSDLKKGHYTGSSEKIGTIVYKQKTVERKITAQVLWAGVGNAEPVYNRDSIRTDSGASATIFLDNGTEIELNEKTLVVLSLQASTTRIDFGGGSLAVKQEKGESAAGVKLVSDAFSIDMADGALSLARGPDDRMELAVKSGTASVDEGRGPQVLAGGTILRSSVTGGLAFSRSTYTLHGPVHGARFLSAADRHAVSFSWSGAAASGGDGTEVLISADPLCRQNVRRIRANSDTGVTAELAPGIFYWKVTDKGGESTVSRFSVVRDEAPRIMLPADGSRFSYLASPPPVRFHWEASPNAVSCNVEIFRDASRKERVVIHPVIGNSLSLDTLTEGTYYWQVRNVYGSPAVVSEMASALWSFTVKKTTSLAAPQHDQKGYSRTATILAVKSGQEKLGWRRVPGADSYQVELAKDSGFSAILARMAARYNYTVIPETCEKGTYYWRVTAQAGRDRSPPSEERQLIVAGSEVLETIAPAEGGRYPREAAGLSFSWMDPNRGAQYLVEVADSALFSTIIASQRVGDRRIVLRHLPAAMLFWRVSLVEKNGSRVAMSKPVSFSLYGHRKAPVLLAPRNGSTLDLIKLDQVLFQWEADHSVSRYRLLVFDAAAGRGAALIDSVSGENRHTVTDIRRFREREYVWEVTALEKTGNQEIPAGDTARGTFTITLTKRVILPGITEPEVVYEDAFTE